MILNSANEYLSGLAARYRTSPLPGFLAWWRGELAGLIPVSIRSRMVPPRPAVWLVPDQAGNIDVWRGGDKPRRLARFEADQSVAGLRGRWLEILGGFDDGRPEIRLCVPADEMLQREVELPLAVESNLATALGYQIDQLTPFRPGQILYDYQVIERDAQHGRLKLDLRLTPISHLEQVRERLAGIGIRPHAIDALGEGTEPRNEGFNLLPENQRPNYVYGRARLNWILAGVVVVVLALVMAQSLYLRERTVDQLQQEVANLRAEADLVMSLQRQLEDSLTAANFLADRRRRQPIIIQVLDEISRILPDDIWLQQVQVQGDEILMMGLADGSQRLIELLNDSPMLDDAEFRGAINVDPATGQERFNVRATITRQEMQYAATARP